MADDETTPAFRAYAPEELLGPLNEIETLNAPKTLWAAGKIDLLRSGPRVAIVGSRKATEEGLRRAGRLARLLVEHGVVVVSGLAEGIDRAAHEAAIDAGGSTIAVLGTPLDKAYPRANADLQHTIIERHLAVSQFPIGQPTQRFNFPLRNRTMALISNASVIVEAGNTSGSLSQGYEALRLGRPLLLMRSLFETPGLTWPEEMLKYGAQILAEPQDIVDLLPFAQKEDLSELAF